MEEQYKSLFTSLQSTIRAAAGVASQDISFHRRLDKTLDRSTSKNSDKLLSLASRIMQHVAKGEVEELVTEEPEDDLTDSWHDVNTALDTLTFKIDECLQQHRLQFKSSESKDKSESSKPNSNTTKLSDKKNSNGSDTVNKHQFDLPKPQEKFQTPVNNSKDEPFRPRITSKPNAIVPFNDSVRLIEASEESGLERPYFPQPYEREIMESEYPQSVFTKREPIPSLPWSTTEPIWVDDVEKLNKMIEDISDAPELAIDLEHHNYRSYLGITCLMQLSDRNNDYIIDTIALRDSLYPLNKIFTDPNIVKILHGATMDIIWLQRDLGLYVVSLFDTFHASKELNLKRNGLAYLLESYANFQTSKKYQLADWRVRPIPDDMLSYAQSDTHFLLNIYDQMKNQLVDKNSVATVLEESRKTASQRFEMPGYDDSLKLNNPFAELAVSDLSRKNNLTQSQNVFLETLYEWRDKVARKVDESPSFIMPIHLLISLSRAMPLTAREIIRLAGPHGQRLREYSKDLQDNMKKAQSIVESLENANESVSTEEAKSMDQDYEKILENYEAYERIQHQAQQSIFNHQILQEVSSKYQKQSSLFWGLTMLRVESADPEAAELLFPIEHLPDGLPLYSDSIEIQQAEADEPPAETNSEAREADKDIVFIGNSSNTEKISNINDVVKNTQEPVSDGTILMPTAAELLGSNIKLLTKNERKKLKREKRRLEEEQKQLDESGETNEPETQPGNRSSNNSGSSKKNKKRSKAESEETDEPSSKKQKTESSDDKPFDYANAPSVLYADSEGSRKSRKNKKQREFNPYGTIDSKLTGAVKKDINTKTVNNTSVSYKVGKPKKK